jgi:hypothetical protein
MAVCTRRAGIRAFCTGSKLLPVPPELAGFPVLTTIPVAWGDMDAFGHVNNVQ